MTIDGRGGGTGAAPVVLKDNLTVPIQYALHRARAHLAARGVDDLDIVATGFFRTSADVTKAIAMGATAVAMATASMIAIGCRQYLACHTGNCPVGIGPSGRTSRRASTWSCRASAGWRRCARSARRSSCCAGRSACSTWAGGSAMRTYPGLLTNAVRSALRSKQEPPRPGAGRRVDPGERLRRARGSAGDARPLRGWGRDARGRPRLRHARLRSRLCPRQRYPTRPAGRPAIPSPALFQPSAEIRVRQDDVRTSNASGQASMAHAHARGDDPLPRVSGSVNGV